MKKPRFLKVMICAACWLIIILALMFTVLDTSISDRERFLEQYKEYGTEAVFGISPEDSADALMAMITYMQGKRESIQLTVTEYGRQVEMFNRQEIDHMVDVRALYRSFGESRPTAAVALLLIIVLSFEESKRGRHGLMVRSFFTAAALFMAIAIVLGAWAITDFTSFWVEFHHLFFTNDLWLMDPAVCRMIRICPEELFSGLALDMALKSMALI